MSSTIQESFCHPNGAQYTASETLQDIFERVSMRAKTTLKKDFFERMVSAALSAGVLKQPVPGGGGVYRVSSHTIRESHVLGVALGFSEDDVFQPWFSRQHISVLEKRPKALEELRGVSEGQANAIGFGFRRAQTEDMSPDDLQDLISLAKHFQRRNRSLSKENRKQSHEVIRCVQKFFAPGAPLFLSEQNIGLLALYFGIETSALEYIFSREYPFLESLGFSEEQKKAFKRESLQPFFHRVYTSKALQRVQPGESLAEKEFQELKEDSAFVEESLSSKNWEKLNPGFVKHLLFSYGVEQELFSSLTDKEALEAFCLVRALRVTRKEEKPLHPKFLEIILDMVKYPEVLRAKEGEDLTKKSFDVLRSIQKVLDCEEGFCEEDITHICRSYFARIEEKWLRDLKNPEGRRDLLLGIFQKQPQYTPPRFALKSSIKAVFDDLQRGPTRSQEMVFIPMGRDQDLIDSEDMVLTEEDIVVPEEMDSSLVKMGFAKEVLAELSKTQKDSLFKMVEIHQTANPIDQRQKEIPHRTMSELVFCFDGPLESSLNRILKESLEDEDSMQTCLQGLLNWIRLPDQNLSLSQRRLSSFDDFWDLLSRQAGILSTDAFWNPKAKEADSPVCSKIRQFVEQQMLPRA